MHTNIFQVYENIRITNICTVCFYAFHARLSRRPETTPFRDKIASGTTRRLWTRAMRINSSTTNTIYIRTYMYNYTHKVHVHVASTQTHWNQQRTWSAWTSGVTLLHCSFKSFRNDNDFNNDGHTRDFHASPISPISLCSALSSSSRLTAPFGSLHAVHLVCNMRSENTRHHYVQQPRFDDSWYLATA